MSTGAPEHGKIVSWPHPLRPGTISMPSDAVKTISAEALRWLMAQPASEIGGILWGSFEDDSVHIADAEFVFSEDSFFNQTSADARRLGETISRANKGKRSAVGYFRSHIRDGLALSEQDRKLIEAHLTDPHSVFVLVKPFQMGISMAAFFFWENGRLQDDVSDLEVPFVALDRTISAPPARSPAPVSIPPLELSGGELAAHEVPVPEIDREQPLPPIPAVSERARPERKWSHLPAVAAALLLGISTAGLVYWATRGFAPAPAAPSPDLQVSRRADGQLDLTWNPRSLPASGARSGAIVIRDGSVSRTIRLDHAQLRSGELAYFPQTENVQFRLELLTEQNRTISEALDVVPPPPGKPGLRRLDEEGAATYQQPRPLHQVMPDTEILAPVAWAGSGQVRVEVDVDASGRVAGAEALKEGTAAPPGFVHSAVAAAREWTFSPATLDGKPVASHHTIVFQFDRAVR